MQVVEIDWLDAQSGFSIPIDMEEVGDIKPIITKSVGYLLRDDNEGVVLGFMLFGEQSFKHWQFIPKGMIQKRKVIRK